MLNLASVQAFRGRADAWSGLLSTALHGPEVLCMELLTSGGFYSFYFLKFNYLNKFLFLYIFCLWWRDSTWMDVLHGLAGFLFFIF
uniref:Candidate secreted effector n=1 Tax=Meloidogyne incognita TaxID=6306 RepID=A0A914MI22_MELIC